MYGSQKRALRTISHLEELCCELSLHLLRGDARVAELRLRGVAEAEGLHARHAAEGRGGGWVVDLRGLQAAAAGAQGLGCC